LTASLDKLTVKRDTADAKRLGLEGTLHRQEDALSKATEI
jgi:hypothetical protein